MFLLTHALTDVSANHPGRKLAVSPGQAGSLSHSAIKALTQGVEHTTCGTIVPALSGEKMEIPDILEISPKLPTAFRAKRSYTFAGLAAI